jgi:PhnB protein
MAKKKAAKSIAKKRPAAKKAVKRIAPKKKAPAILKDGRPARMWWPALAPFLTVRDGQAAIEFYDRAFGFDTYGEVMRGDDGKVQHASMRLGESAIMLGPIEGAMGLVPVAPGTPDSLTLYVYVPNVDSVAERARRAGATQVQLPTDQFWGDRTAVFKDPDGFHWTFATHLGK